MLFLGGGEGGWSVKSYLNCLVIKGHKDFSERLENVNRT